MVTLVRVAKVVLLLVLALVVISLVMALGGGTGVVEKVALVALIVGSVVLAYLLTKWADRIQERLATRS